MEYFPHTQDIKKCINMDKWQTFFFFKALLEALGAMHQKGIVHRDVNFSNFLFFQHLTCPSKSKYMLVDFGSAQKIGGLKKMELQRLLSMNADAFKSTEAKHFPRLKPTSATYQGCKIENSKYKCNHLPCSQFAALKYAQQVLKKDIQHPLAKIESKGTDGYKAPEVILKSNFQDGS